MPNEGGRLKKSFRKNRKKMASMARRLPAMYQPFLVFGVHPKSVSKMTALGMATAHCNHVGQSSIFVTPLFPPSAARRLPTGPRGLQCSRADLLPQRPLPDSCEVYDESRWRCTELAVELRYAQGSEIMSLDPWRNLAYPWLGAKGEVHGWHRAASLRPYERRESVLFY